MSISILSTVFLNAVLGKDGAAALTKAVARHADLADVLVPRTVLSFVTSVQALGYKGEIPGIPGSLIALTKSGGVIDDQAFTGPDANAYTMAAHLAIMLGVEADRKLAKNTRDLDLTRFGKSIDLLVKSRMVRDSLRKKKLKLEGDALIEVGSDGLSLGKGPVNKTDLPGTTAKPMLTGPIQAKAPQKQPAQQDAKASTKKPKPTVAPPRTKDKVDPTKDIDANFAKPPKLPDLKISKSEAHSVRCKVCNQTQFRPDGGFYGCLCLRGLSPFALIKAEPDSYIIRFGPEWDADAVEVLFECMHGIEA